MYIYFFICFIRSIPILSFRPFISIEYTNESYIIVDSNERYFRYKFAQLQRSITNWVSGRIGFPEMPIHNPTVLHVCSTKYPLYSYITLIINNNYYYYMI